MFFENCMFNDLSTVKRSHFFNDWYLLGSIKKKKNASTKVTIVLTSCTWVVQYLFLVFCSFASGCFCKQDKCKQAYHSFFSVDYFFLFCPSHWLTDVLLLVHPQYLVLLVSIQNVTFSLFFSVPFDRIISSLFWSIKKKKDRLPILTHQSAFFSIH